MTLGALLSAVIEISKCTSQSAALTLASCRNALATWTTLRRLLVVGNVGTISAAVSQSESLIRDWGNW